MSDIKRMDLNRLRQCLRFKRVSAWRIYGVIGLIAFTMLACKQQTAPSPSASKGTRITVTHIQHQDLEISEEVVGNLEGLVAPIISAEVAARISALYVTQGQAVKQGQVLAIMDNTDFSLQHVAASAEVARVSALLENQQKVVNRARGLVEKNFISQAGLETELTQEQNLKEQLASAKAQLNVIAHTRDKTTLRSPISGVVEKRWVDTGGFVKVGDPIVQIVSPQHLRAHLLFPERMVAKIAVGLKVRLRTPTSPSMIESQIRELKPLVNADSRTLEAIVDINHAPHGWQAGGSVNGQVILDVHPSAKMLPEQSLVLRPVGEVVYAIRGNRAIQIPVTSGLHLAGKVEVLGNLSDHEVIAVDGAGFLAHNALVKINR